MNSKIIIAAAGSGKTTSLVDFALTERGKILITTYTDNNVSEIRKSIITKNKCIPSNITIMPWYTFLLTHWVRPFQGVLYEGRIKGMQLVNGQSTQYVKSSDITRYYFSNDCKIFSDKISKFGKICNKKSRGAVIERLSALFDYILVDELQDITGEDLDILGILIQSKISTRFVGDPRQSTFQTNPSLKNKSFKQQNQLTYFEQYVNKGLCEIDETSLLISYRCNKTICDLANKLYPYMSQVKS